jgi:hypothetical protein
MHYPLAMATTKRRQTTQTFGKSADACWPRPADQAHRWRDLACPIADAGLWRLHRQRRREDLHLPRLRAAPLPLQAPVGGFLRADHRDPRRRHRTITESMSYSRTTHEQDWTCLQPATGDREGNCPGSSCAGSATVSRRQPTLAVAPSPFPCLTWSSPWSMKTYVG